MAKLTLIGLTNYDPNLWDGLRLPEGVDKDTLIGTMLTRGGEMEVLYSNIDFFKSMLPVWSNKWYRTIDKWVKAFNTEYSPLENYDRYEEWTEAHTGSNHGNASNNTSSNANGSTESKVSAYDSSVYQPKDFDESHNNGSSTGTETISGNNKSDDKHIGHLHGNIGVTSSQQMLQQEIEISRFSLYDNISELFLSEIVIPIY